MINIAFDSHKRYTCAVVSDEKCNTIHHGRIEHQRGEIIKFLAKWPQATHVAVETIGNWYWIVDEIEEAGKTPLLVHARRAKMMSGNVHKTDRMDAAALNRLAVAGTLPTVWIAGSDVRDRRELLRTRAVLSGQRTGLKNRIHSILDKYATGHIRSSDIFSVRGLAQVHQHVEQLPPSTRTCARILLTELQQAQEKIGELDELIEEAFAVTPNRELLQSLPGVGKILSAVIECEIGDISRFAGPGRLCSYAGTVPRVYSSGGKTRHLRSSNEVNHYLKWAYSEAANVVALGWRRNGTRYVDGLYLRVRSRKGHAIAVGAVARHLAESSWHMMSRGERYREHGLITSRQVRGRELS